MSEKGYASFSFCRFGADAFIYHVDLKICILNKLYLILQQHDVVCRQEQVFNGQHQA
jgi:hypothetical protein